MVLPGRDGVPSPSAAGGGCFDDFMIKRLRLPLHRLDARFCGRRRNWHIRRRCWLPMIARCNNNDNHRRNQQRRSADHYYHSFCHLAIRKASQLNFSAFNSRAYTVKLIQKSPTLLSPDFFKVHTPFIQLIQPSFAQHT